MVVLVLAMGNGSVICGVGPAVQPKDAAAGLSNVTIGIKSFAQVNVITGAKPLAHTEHLLTPCVAKLLKMKDGFNAHLEGANLTGAHLCNSDFTKANLSGAHFGRANLTGAKFTGSDLTYVNFINSDDIFTGAQFIKTVGLNPENKAYVAANGAIVKD